MKRINYSFNKAFLGPQFRKTFEEMCLKHKIIKKDLVFGEKEEYDGWPLTGEKEILRAMVLFDKIDFPTSIYDCTELIDRGVIDENNICNSDIELDQINMNRAAQIMKAYKKDVISFIIKSGKDYLKFFQKKNSPSRDFWKDVHFSSELVCSFCCGDFYVDLNDEYNKIIDHLDFLVSLDGQTKRLIEKHEVSYSATELELLGVRNNIAYALKSCEESDSVYLGGFLNSDGEKSLTNPGKDIYGFVKTRLPDEVCYLPMPQTLDDVWRMRKKTCIKDFRKIMEEWNYYINQNELKAADKIKKDIIKVNSGFEKLERVKKFVYSPYIRTGIFALGFVPLISYFINIISYVIPMYIEEKEMEFSWTHINDK